LLDRSSTWTRNVEGFRVAPDESVDNRGVSAPLVVQPDGVCFEIRWFDGAGSQRRMTNRPPTL
jgi:hypothetical protein